MSYSRNTALARRHQAGDRAATEELLKLNAGLLAGIARRYLHNAGSLEMEDLLQEARLGLIEAANRFDTERGIQFSTFASYHIARAVQRAVETTGATIRLPSHVHDRIRRAGDGERDQRWLAQIPRNIVSLDLPAGEDGDAHLADLISAPVDIEAEFVGREWTAHVLGLLDPRERAIIKARCGLGWTGRTETLGELGNRHGLSREGVRQVEARALRKIRAHCS